jgi:catechol 2,3-dioxygenase-like lactoylglutathione lyase family enzyme
MITGFHHTAITTVKMDEMLVFYSELLGFEYAWEFDVEGVERGAFMRAGNAFIELFEYPAGTLSPRRVATESGQVHFCLSVENMDAEYARLSNAGVEFEGPPKRFGRASFCFMFDPEGNKIELLEVEEPEAPFHLSQSEPLARREIADSDLETMRRSGEELRLAVLNL